MHTMKILAATFFLFVLGMLGDARAQDDWDSTGKADQIDEEHVDSMSMSQKAAWARTQIQVVKDMEKKVSSMLKSARKEKDPIKASCLEDKLTQMVVSIKGVEERKAAFDSYYQTEDTASAEQQFTMIKIYVDRVHTLMGEAENCIGDLESVIGESETMLTIDDDITDEDPTEIQEIVDIDQIPHISGFY